MTRIIRAVLKKNFYIVFFSLSVSVLVTIAEVSANDRNLLQNAALTKQSLTLNQVKLNRIVIAYQNFCMKKLFPNSPGAAKDGEQSPQAKEIKNEIFNYCRLKNISVSPEVLRAAWKEYLVNNFHSQAQLDEYLRTKDIRLEELQKDFYERLVFIKYFDLEVKPRIVNDYNKRLKILNKANKLAVIPDDTMILEKLYLYETKLGGKQAFKDRLLSYDLDLEDLVFYTKSELVKDSLAEKIFLKRFNADPVFKKKIQAKVQEEYLNIKKNNLAAHENYYFRQFYIDKEAESAIEKISYLKKILIREPNYRVVKDLFKDLVVFDMVIPVNNLDNFYAKNISDGVMKLRKPLQISNIISSDYGYHILQLKKIERNSDQTLEQLSPSIFQDIQAKYVTLIRDEL
jgi:hypothetical protein